MFSGQRDDGFYGDIQAVFDLLSVRTPGRDSQAGFNVHTIVLDIPVSELGGEMQVVGVYATTSRRSTTVLPENQDPPDIMGNFVQVARQGNPLFCEALVPIQDKDLYNRTGPSQDTTLFNDFVLNPEIAVLINLILSQDAPTTERTDIAQIFVPDMLRVDLSTAPARLAGPPDDSGFSSLSVFGVDFLASAVQDGFPNLPPGTVAGGWPNGRRFGDDVIDIAVTALLSDLRPGQTTLADPFGDLVDSNDIAYNKVFPYAATPHNGRTSVHEHQISRPPTLFFPHFGNGGGIRSDLVLSNPSLDTTVAGSVSFAQDDGTPFAVELASEGEGKIVPLQAVSSVSFSIPPRGTETISTDGLGEVAVAGSATVTADGAVGGVVKFDLSGVGIAGVGATEPLNGFVIPARRAAGGINTGVAIHNSESTPVSLTLRLFDSGALMFRAGQLQLTI